MSIQANRMKTFILFRWNYLIPFIVLLIIITNVACGKKDTEVKNETNVTVIPFGSGGQVKMVYDRRQRPQALYINNRVHIVYNGGASKDLENNEKTYPFTITFDPNTEAFSSPVQLGKKGSGDHHHCPIIWADNQDYLHVLYGNHSTAGKHLISNNKADIGKSVEDWSLAPKVRHSLSYPTVYNIYNNYKLVYFRTGEHRSAWTYLISADEGKTWEGPDQHVVDLNMGGETQPENNQPGIEEWSSYHTCLPSKDGQYLHIAFCYYNDNKKKVPEKFYNPRYQTKTNLNIKYNLYYVKVNLENHEVTNFDGESVKTPVSMETANDKCNIWDTDWRGAGIPPDIIIDDNDNPAFLHVLSENTPNEFNYHYLRNVDGNWEQTIIARSNHRWNSSYLKLDSDGILHAYIVVGENNSNGKEGSMDRYGGGKIEEWCSYDNGNAWIRVKDLTPKSAEYADWKFNNIQPIKDPNGNEIEGMFVFYGWKDSEARIAKAFLLKD